MLDSHYIYQDAALTSLAGYSKDDAIAIILQGRNPNGTTKGTPHYNASQVQKQRGGGTLEAERRIAYKALRRAGLSEDESYCALMKADSYLSSIGATPKTATTYPKGRRK